MKVSDFDYHLPPELIAQYPAPERQAARLLVLRRATGAIEHRLFPDLLDYLAPGDLLVLNETRVFPARLFGRMTGTGGKLEVVLLRERQPGTWEALVQPGRRARPGTTVLFGDGRLRAEVLDLTPEGGRALRFSPGDPDLFWRELFRLGEVPLPPYIKRRPEESDRERYQTVYARVTGSVAAPTAGLHFTPELLEQIRNQGVHTAFLVLHVGLGTFRPVKAEQVEQHRMHEEFWRLGRSEADLINDTRRRGGRIVAVGTTTVRALESAAASGRDRDGNGGRTSDGNSGGNSGNSDGSVAPGEGCGSLVAGEGWTRLFIYPGYRFRIIDGLVTNFHLPRSTLLMLVSAFAGREQVLRAYREAVAGRYRFFSYGDAMLIM